MADVLLSKRKTRMNANQIHGTISKMVGLVQEQMGHWVGSRRQVLRGLQRQVSGAAEKRVGDVQVTSRHPVSRSRGLHL